MGHWATEVKFCGTFSCAGRMGGMSEHVRTLVLGVIVNGFYFAVAGALGGAIGIGAPCLLASLFLPINWGDVARGCTMAAGTGAVLGVALYLCLVIAYCRRRSTPHQRPPA